MNQQQDNTHLRSRFRGCLLGGAVGDALGAPVEFLLSFEAIQQAYGPEGIQEYDRAYGRTGAITDDTQMTLFTAEGLIRALVRGRERGICHVPSVVHHAYLRWLHTQGGHSPHKLFNPPFDGWLIKERRLFSSRAPGKTCLKALQGDRMGTIENPLNDRKGCGGVMRIAPVGLLAEKRTAFDLGAEIAAITHGHPSGYLAAGFLSHVIACLREGMGLDLALDEACSILQTRDGHEEVLREVTKARELARSTRPSAEIVEWLGDGWVAEEALGISIYCALVAGDDFARAVRLAVNHKGDSDSTGAITGNIVGMILGEEAIPNHWLEQLELREVIARIADDLLTARDNTDGLWNRYPGW